MFALNQINFVTAKGWDIIIFLATLCIGERCLKEISKYLISSAIWSLSRAPERRAARSQAKPKQRIAHWANNDFFVHKMICLYWQYDYNRAVQGVVGQFLVKRLFV